MTELREIHDPSPSKLDCTSLELEKYRLGASRLALSCIEDIAIVVNEVAWKRRVTNVHQFTAEYSDPYNPIPAEPNQRTSLNIDLNVIFRSQSDIKALNLACLPRNMISLRSIFRGSSLRCTTAARSRLQRGQRS